MKIFLTSFTQIALVAINTILLQKGLIIGIFMASFTISFIWCYNVAKVSVSTRKAKIIYSLGAGCGGVFGYYFINFIAN
jgi:hypothetical protein